VREKNGKGFVLLTLAAYRLISFFTPEDPPPKLPGITQFQCRFPAPLLYI